MDRDIIAGVLTEALEAARADAPTRIYATVNGASTRLPEGSRQLIGGWGERSDSPRAVEYIRADIVAGLVEALKGFRLAEGNIVASTAGGLVLCVPLATIQNAAAALAAMEERNDG